jgi:hypothetical protein
MGHIQEGKFDIILKGEDLDEYYTRFYDINFRDFQIEGVVHSEGTYEMSSRGEDDVYSYGVSWRIEIKSITPSLKKQEIDLLCANGKDWKTELEELLIVLAENNNDYDFC